MIISSKQRCKECAGAASDDDYISCHKCKKRCHWCCSGLSNYDIKLHKNNPYKPWWCGPCIDKYCFQCNRTFKTDNQDSICCDRCSFWFHSDCSQLSVDEFNHLCSNPSQNWTCIPCKKKICVRCKISTHNKPKISCCLCKNLYHNVCVGLSKSTGDKEDWLCTSCRPSVFPFHNLDLKNLHKLYTNNDKFLLESLNLLACDMSRECTICEKKLSKSNLGIPCFCCKSKIHVKCSKINDPKNSFSAFKGNWQCEKCARDKFPFFDTKTDDLIELFTDPLANKGKFSPEFLINDKLKLLLSASNSSNWHAHICDEDADPRGKNENKPNFNYYDIPEFRKTQQTWDRSSSFSLFHTNVGSLQCNFHKMDDLLTDLAWKFDIISVSETWNDEINKNDFVAPLLQGYRYQTL